MKSEGFLLRGISGAVSLLVRLIKVTTVCRYIGFEEYRERLLSGRTVLIAFWHNQGLFMPFAYFGKSGKIKIIVSQSRDGDMIAALLRWFGILSVRGSSSRGSTAALKELLRLARTGDHSLVFTPDGPKGPIYRVKGGIAYLATTSNKPLYLLSVSYTRVKILGSWDHFRVPLPFGQATYVCSPPLHFNRNGRGQGTDAECSAIEECLNAVNRIADALTGEAITLRESAQLLASDRLPWYPYSLDPPPGEK